MLSNLVGFGFLGFSFNQEGKSPQEINYTVSLLKIVSQALESHWKDNKKEGGFV